MINHKAKLPILEVVLLSEVEDPQISTSLRSDPKCWGISDLDTLISYVIFDRIVFKVKELDLSVIDVLAEGCVHELIHTTMRYDYRANIASENNIYAMTYVILDYFYLDHVKKRLPEIFKKTLAQSGIDVDYFKILKEHVIDVRC